MLKGMGESYSCGYQNLLCLFEEQNMGNKFYSCSCDFDVAKRIFATYWGLSAGTGKHCVFGRLGLVLIWSCFVSVFCFLCFT